jgi:hypothetical protein
MPCSSAQLRAGKKKGGFAPGKEKLERPGQNRPDGTSEDLLKINTSPAQENPGLGDLKGEARGISILPFPQDNVRL